jgi:hypothetical protein
MDLKLEAVMAPVSDSPSTTSVVASPAGFTQPPRRASNSRRRNFDSEES